MRRRLTLKIVVPVLAAVVLAVVGTVAVLTKPDSSPVVTAGRESGVDGSVAGSAAQTAPAGAATGGKGVTPDNLTAAVPPGGLPPAHYLIRNGDLVLLLDHGSLLATVDRIGELVARMGGYVMSSSVGGGGNDDFVEPRPADGSEPSATEAVSSLTAQPTEARLTLRVPQARFEEAVERLTKLAEVRRITTSSEDVTTQYVDLQARLRHHRAVERRLLRFLAATTTIRETLAVQDRLDAVQLTIEQLEAQLKSLREVTTYGTLTVTLTEKDAPQAGQIDSSDTFVGVLRTSLRALAHGARIVALAITAALPFIVVLGGIGLAAWHVTRRLLRRRRHAQTPSVTT